MSGQKKLNRVTKNIRVAAMPSKVRKDYALDENGQIMKETQLYRVKQLK